MSSKRERTDGGKGVESTDDKACTEGSNERAECSTGHGSVQYNILPRKTEKRADVSRDRTVFATKGCDVPSEWPAAIIHQADWIQRRGIKSPSEDISEHRIIPIMGNLHLQEQATLLEKKVFKLKPSPFVLQECTGTKGHKIPIIANYFEIELPHGEVYHYDVEIQSVQKQILGETDANGDSVGTVKKHKCLNTRHNRKVIETILRKVNIFKDIRPAYDGNKNLYTRNPLPIRKQITYSLETYEDDRISSYEITIQPVSKEGQTTPMISLEPLHQFIAGKTMVISEEISMGVMALETILRHGPALKLIPVGRSFFHKPHEDEIPRLSGGREIWMGYHQSIRIAQWKPMINIDMSATTFYKSGPVINYMMDIFYPNESDEYKIRELHRIWYLTDSQWCMLAKELKTLRVEVTHLPYPRKYRVKGISITGADNTFFVREIEGVKEKVSVADYFRAEYHSLRFPNLPCIEAASANKSIFLPLEVCNIVEGQHCKKKLTDTQTAEMSKYTARPPAEWFINIGKAIKQTKEEFEPFAEEFGIRINTDPTKLEGRVLEPPHIMYDHQQAITPNNGAWNMKDKRFFNGQNVDKWVLISFSTDRWCDRNALEKFAIMLCRGGRQVGMAFDEPALIQTFGGRVVPGDIIKNIKYKEPSLQLVVVVLPTKGGPPNIYNEIKSVAETELGLMTQCVKDSNVNGRKCNPQLICNLCQKINAKMGGINNSLAPTGKPPILKRPVIIIGADSTHPPGDRVKPSIAAVVGSLDGYPSRYKASVRIRMPNDQDKATNQIILDLKEMIKELLKQFYRHTNGKKPEKIIFYRKGVGEGEFEDVVYQEVYQVRQACREINRAEEYKPPITFIVVGRRHHTRFAPENRRDGVGKHCNVPPGTTVDTIVTRTVRSDFFMCSHEGIRGTSRPTHYTVLWDDSNLDMDELQKLTYFLCHTYVRCTRSISIPCPLMYARLAATRAKQYLIYKSEEMSSSGSDWSMPTPKEVLRESVQQAIRVVEHMQNTMYFV